MPPQFNRQTAVPCTLAEIMAGAWRHNPGLEPSGVETVRGMISRASVLGVIVERAEDNTLLLDDGTARVTLRSFETQKAPSANVGEVVLVIGKPREYNGERYLVLEICKKLRNKGWIEYRKRELERITPPPAPVQQKPVAPAPVQVRVPETQKKNPFEIVIAKIRELDLGSGADVQEVIIATNMPDAEQLMQTLIEEGEIFEAKPGRVKVLE